MSELPELHAGRLHALVAPRPLRQVWLNTFTARLALAGPLRLLDGGNSLQMHSVARLVRQHGAALEPTLGRVHLARAFTCYQMYALLAGAAALPLPTLVPELLSTFYDESIEWRERRRLLEVSLGLLRRLSRHAVILVSAAPEAPGRAQLPPGEDPLSLLLEAADQVWRFEQPPTPQQPALF